MKKYFNKILAASIICLHLFSSCENGDQTFSDYSYQTVYFAKQSPVRTILLGDDVYPNQLDNEHKFQIKATLGGVWSNESSHQLRIAIDESLCDGLTYDDGSPVLPMPSSYYSLSSDIITIPAGEVQGGVTVQLNDAFFEDKKSLRVCYVVPVRIIEAQDSILVGKAKENVKNPIWQNPDDWSTAPHNYTLYAVKYKNPYDGAWISHGTDYINVDGITTVNKREAEYLEKNEIRYITSSSLTQSHYDLSTVVDITNASGEATTATLNATLLLDIDAEGHVTISAEDKGEQDIPGSGSKGTYTVSATGSGTWEHQGAKKAWGDKDRDLLTLHYELTYTYHNGNALHFKKYTCDDTLVMRDHQSYYELFTANYKK